MTRPALLALTVAATAALAVAQTTRPTPTIATLAAFDGTWVLEGKWANGNPIKARQLYQPTLGGQAVVCQTWSASGTAAETPRDLVVYSEQDGRVTQTAFTPDGRSRQTPATPTTDGSLQFDWTQTDAKGKTTELRQVLTPVDANHYGWRLMMHIKGEWHTLLDGQWKRG